MEVSRLAAAHERRRHPVSVSIDLNHDFVRQVGIPFRTVPIREPSDYDCESEGVFGCRHLDVGMNGNVIVVRLGKYRILDELTVNKISAELLGVADRPDCHGLLVDFSGVIRLTSGMLARLVMLYRKMELRGGKLELCGVSSPLRSVFATTRLDRLFDVTDTEAHAVNAATPRYHTFAE
jgi:anti-anti-sigma factor